jgi:hypothetical protein
MDNWTAALACLPFIILPLIRVDRDHPGKNQRRLDAANLGTLLDVSEHREERDLGVMANLINFYTKP